MEAGAGVQDRVAQEPGAGAEQAVDRGEHEDHSGHYPPGRNVHESGASGMTMGAVGGSMDKMVTHPAPGLATATNARR